MYSDPYVHFGRLSNEMWRAVRLVVDTGMHYKHWTRQQAIDYFLAHVATTEYNATSEVDRYISWPGQALAYKMGELEIKNCGSAPKKNWDRSSTFAPSTMPCCWMVRYPLNCPGEAGECLDSSPKNR